jgi:hypothetical protein
MNRISQYLPETPHYIIAAAVSLVSFATGSSPITALAIAALSQLPSVIGIEREASTLLTPAINKTVENNPSQYKRAVGYTLSSTIILGLSTCSIYGGGLLGSALFGTRSISLIQAGIGGACDLAIKIDHIFGSQALLQARNQVNSFIESLTR